MGAPDPVARSVFSIIDDNLLWLRLFEFHALENGCNFGIKKENPDYIIAPLEICRSLNDLTSAPAGRAM